MNLNLYNAVDGAGRTLSLHMAAGCMAEAAAGGFSVDLGGARVLPGLVNAHDHLQLNAALPRLGFRELYRNASEWIADITPRLSSDPRLMAHRAVPREQRFFIGGLKNLFCGATTVAHHDPRVAALDDGTSRSACPNWAAGRIRWHWTAKRRFARPAGPRSPASPGSFTQPKVWTPRRPRSSIDWKRWAAWGLTPCSCMAWP